MTVNIPLSPEIETKLRKQAEAAGTDIAGFILAAVHDKLDTLDDADTGVHGQLSADQWIARLRRWAASHRSLPHEADDSRESIYAGRGE